MSKLTTYETLKQAEISVYLYQRIQDNISIQEITYCPSSSLPTPHENHFPHFIIKNLHKFDGTILLMKTLQILLIRPGEIKMVLAHWLSLF